MMCKIFGMLHFNNFTCSKTGKLKNILSKFTEKQNIIFF